MYKMKKPTAFVLAITLALALTGCVGDGGQESAGSNTPTGTASKTPAAAIANEPDLTGFNPATTYYVAWNTNSDPYEINDGMRIDGTAPDNWYDYTVGQNKWANIKTTGGGNDCYWVWIPRYAYQAPERSGTPQTINIKFLQGDTNTPVNENAPITNTIPTAGEWVVHPAFTNAGNGGLGELKGIWVAKFTASSSSVGVEPGFGGQADSVSYLAGLGGGPDTNLQIRSIPNVVMWRGINVNDIFAVCENMASDGNTLEGSTGMVPHLMKNTEWGMVAYLSMSQYGKNDRVFKNPYYNNETDYSPITGLAGATATQTNNGIMTDLYEYNTPGGINASTSGNVYGIYDMAGGAWECVAGYLSELANPLPYYTAMSEADGKYKDKYAGTTASGQTNYDLNTGKYGDAIYETSISGDNYGGSWGNSHAKFPISSSPVFVRGGHAFYEGNDAGVFAFSNYTGEADAYTGFRPCLVCP
ncbi:MAG: hypothetical protein FWF33_01795 [Clostridiales bacterium]|nr:hypothetical protein [Clostridiales bacterium]